MTLRLCICLFILLMITLISRQNPVPVLNSDVSQMKYSDIRPLNYKDKADTGRSARFKRQSGDETSEGEHHNQGVEEHIEKQSNEQSDRNKRLETEEEGAIERNQFYKPINEETKETHPLAGSRQDIDGNSGHKIAVDLSGPRKLNGVNIRPQRQAVGAWGEAFDRRVNNTAAFRENSENLEELDGNSNNVEYIQSLYSAQRRGRDNSELQELAGINHFSSETLETMRKINPLTIGDQVSQMIHERKCNPNNKMKDKSTYESGPGALQNEDEVADPSSVFLQDTEDVAKQRSGYVKQRPPKIVQKPVTSNDYGFSVIILAGDPLKMAGSGASGENTGKEDKGLKKKQKSCSEDVSRDTSRTNGQHLNSAGVNLNPPNMELRVPKDPKAKFEFPVYDQDLNSPPDPLNGLLEPNYWVNPGKKEDDKFRLGGNQASERRLGGYQAFPRHRIRVRGAQSNNSQINNAQSNNAQSNNAQSNIGNNNILGTTSNDACTREVTVVATTPATTSVTDDDFGCDAGPSIEEFGDLGINPNMTICQSWREPDASGSNNDTSNANATVV